KQAVCGHAPVRWTPRGNGWLRQRVFDEDVIQYRTAADQVLLDDPLEHRRIAAAIPRALGIDERNRSAFADAQAVGLRAQDPALSRQTEFLQPPLQKLPRLESARLLAALRRRLIAAQEDVPPRDRNADVRRQTHRDAIRDRA